MADITEQQFISIVKEYERVIYKVCFMYASDRAPLSDLYQEVVINIWRAYPTFRNESKLSTWIYRIALNTCISFVRKEKNIPKFIHLSTEIYTFPEEQDELNGMLQELHRLINRLGQLDKSIVLLYLEEKPYEEIAEITGLSVSNVGTRLNRIREKMRKMKKK